MARAQTLLLGLVCAVLTVPLLLVDVPPLLDYPNHLARIFVAAHRDDPLLAGMFAPNWGLIPNLAVDLLGPPLLWLFPVHVAGRLLIALAVLLPVLGCVAYHRAVFGERSWWPLASGLVAYNAALLLGFLNFVLSLGLALLLAAGWIAWRERRPTATLAVAFAGAVLLFFCHLMGLAFFAVLVGSFEIEQAWRHGGWWRRGLAIAAILVLPFLLFLASPFQQAQGELGWLPIGQKLVQLIFPFLNYDFPLDVASAYLVIGFALLCLALGWGVLPPHCAAALGLLGLLGAIAPFGYKGTMALDARFAIMVGFLTFAGISLSRLPQRLAGWAMAGFAGLFVLRMALLSTAWHAHQDDVDQLRRVIAEIPPGAAVAVSSVTPEEAPEYWQRAPAARRLSDGSTLDAHMAGLLLIERRAFWPFLFADASQQPVALRPAFQRLADRTGGMHPHRAMGNTTCGFGYLLLLDAGGEPDLAGYGGDRLHLLLATEKAALFRVQPCDVLSPALPPSKAQALRPSPAGPKPPAAPS